MSLTTSLTSDIKLTPSTTSQTFQFPPAYSFPPFFTLQPNTTTLHSQRQKWSTLILSYCRHHRLTKLSLPESIETDLFYNRKIGKRLGIADAREMVEGMRKEGRAEWIVRKGGEETRDLVWIWWRSLDEWAAGLYDWVSFGMLASEMAERDRNRGRRPENWNYGKGG